jgi:hypothetical protein
MVGLRISLVSHLSALRSLFASLGNDDESHDDDWKERMAISGQACMDSG